MLRCLVALGSMEYSAVIHPWPFPLSHPGTFSMTEAVHMTFVLPKLIKQEPSGYSRKSLTI